MGATKYDTGKAPVHLVPSAAIMEVSRVLGFGAEKYGVDNFRQGFKQSRLIGAALRHILQWKDENHIDSESGLSHLAHAACMILFSLEQELQCFGEDDSWVARRDEVDGDASDDETESESWYVNDVDVENREINMHQLPDGWSVNQDECYELTRDGKIVARVARHASAANVWQWWVKGVGLSAAYGSPGEAMADAVKRADWVKETSDGSAITL